jgi:hypothetical protein
MTALTYRRAVEVETIQEARHQELASLQRVDAGGEHPETALYDAVVAADQVDDDVGRQQSVRAEEL